MNCLLSLRSRSGPSLCTHTQKRYYAKAARQSAPSSRKLAESLVPKGSGRGHLEIAHTPKSRSSPPFIREAAPHTTRVPVPIRRSKPSSLSARRSPDKRREREKGSHDFGGDRRGKEGVAERYGQGQKRWGRQAREDGAESDDKHPHRVTESYRHYLERRDSRQSSRGDPRSHSRSKPQDNQRIPKSSTRDNETSPDEFYHPSEPVSLAQSSKSEPKIPISSDPPTDQFTSPPLLPGLLNSLKEMIGSDARPTPIQSLSLKWLLAHPGAATVGQPLEVGTAPEKWRQFLLASETGSGKSIAYLLPLLQNLKETELVSKNAQTSNPQDKQRPYNPRGLILAPTHELSRQLSGFAKSLLHEIKLRVLCTSQANQKSTSRRDSTSSKMSSKFSEVSLGPLGEFQVAKSTHPVDILVGTPMKVLEMVHGRGWDRKEAEDERDEEIEAGAGEEEIAKKKNLRRGRDKMVGFGKWRNKPELGLANVEWVIVDEADVLFDPDFQETTRTLLADISSARGHLMPVLPSTELSTVNPQLSTPPTSSEKAPINYPFNLLLTSATIPNSLNLYLEKHHPSLIRLASPRLHHLPKTLQTEYVSWTGGNKLADIERRIRRVWAEDSANPTVGSLSKILVFCNKSTKVIEMSEYLSEKGIKNVAMTSQSEHRGRGSNKHLSGFLRKDDDDHLHQISEPSTNVKDSPHVMITTSLLSRGLDFSPTIKHVFIVDEPRNMIDFLHRAGRSGRAGQRGKVVVFGKMTGRGSSKAKDVRKRVGALIL